MYNHVSARAIANRSGAKQDSPLYDAIGDIVADLAAKENTLRTLMASIRARLDAVEGRLDGEGPGNCHLNELGELQGYATSFDVAVAGFCAQHHELYTLLRLAS